MIFTPLSHLIDPPTSSPHATEILYDYKSEDISYYAQQDGSPRSNCKHRRHHTSESSSSSIVLSLVVLEGVYFNRMTNDNPPPSSPLRDYRIGG